jgi:hypothetical protein
MLCRKFGAKVCCCLLLAGQIGAQALLGGEPALPSPAQTHTKFKGETLYHLARQYAKGDGVERDLSKAAKLLGEAAQAGYAPAETDLAAAYANGSGIQQDFSEAANWYRRAAEHDDALAQYTLGRIYLAGRGVPADHHEGVKWLRRAAEHGEAGAMLVLGDLSLNGTPNSTPDFADAFFWFSKAAARGQVAALNSLGFLYEHGSGVPRSPTRAIECFREAAEHQDARGQMNLGRLYLEGQILTRDPVEACKWFKLALRNGELVARHYLFEIESREGLSEEQVADAERRVQDFLKAHRPRPTLSSELTSKGSSADPSQENLTARSEAD